MKKLRVITFSDKPLPESNKLVQSCRANNLNLDVISPEGTWRVNAQKIKLLNDHLASLSTDLIILVVDAFDVYLNAPEQIILEQFYAFKKDVVFSAEANFYFRNPKLKGFYLKHYPNSPTVYRYLNSGTFIGSVKSVKEMLHEIMEQNNLNPQDMNSFMPVRSDQYLYSKHFVGNSLNEDPRLVIGLDYYHSLMEVSGGRMRLAKIPHLSTTHAFNSYKIERFLVKLFKLNHLQNSLIDIRYQSGKFCNTLTNTSPTIIHIPGSWKNFDQILEQLMSIKGDFSVARLLAIPIALTSYLVALIVPVKINY